MSLFSAFDISASGMAVERARLDITAVNLANANTTRSLDGSVFRPLRLLTAPRTTNDFATMLDQQTQRLPYNGVQVTAVESSDAQPHLVYDPGNPDANKNGYVEYPAVDTASEMINLIRATRAYEADVTAMNAAHTMALKALQIGGGQ